MVASRFRRCRRWLQGQAERLRRRNLQAAARRREAALSQQASAGEVRWQLDEVKQAVRDAFHPLQSRWEPGKAQHSRAYVTDALHEQGVREAEELKAQHRTRRIVAPRLDDVEILSIEAQTGGEARAVACVQFSAYESLRDRRNGRVIDGVHGKRRFSRELWTLVLHAENGWVVDEIQRENEPRARSRSGRRPQAMAESAPEPSREPAAAESG